MKALLVWVGKTVEPWLVSGIDNYAKRLKHYLPFEMKEISALKNVKSLSSDQLKTKEGELILSVLQPGDFVVLLDENGKTLSSREFAAMLDSHLLQGTKRIVFVIGGAFGFSNEVYAAAKQSLSLSKMTFSHQMVRVVFLEQLYRANTILKGEPYHHD